MDNLKHIDENSIIYNMDCMEAMKEMKDNEFDLAIVDPPYALKEDGLKNHSRSVLAKSKQYTVKNWDRKHCSKYYFKELKRISKNIIVFGANHFIENIQKANSSGWIVWDKQNGNNDFSDCELAYTSFNKGLRKFTFKWHGMLQGDMKNKEVRIHPTQKPVKLYEWILTNYAKKGDRILDTHLGSGSSRIAAKKHGFDFTGFEIDKEYFENSIKRYNQIFDQKTIFEGA